jgi:hypothetical protein
MGAGGVPAATASAYQRSFVALATHNWRLAHYFVLKGFAEREEWRQAADWMHTAAAGCRLDAQGDAGGAGASGAADQAAA